MYQSESFQLILKTLIHLIFNHLVTLAIKDRLAIVKHHLSGIFSSNLTNNKPDKKDGTHAKFERITYLLVRTNRIVDYATIFRHSLCIKYYFFIIKKLFFLP